MKTKRKFESKQLLSLSIKLLPLFLAALVILSCKDDDDNGNEDSNISLQQIADGLAAPVTLVPSPDESGRLFVVDQVGVIYILENDSMLDTPFLDLRSKLVDLNDSYDERGLLGLAFHPQYQENRRFFVYYSAPLRAQAPQGYDHTSVLSEFLVTQGNPLTADANSESVIMMVNQPQANHNGGTLAFGTDNYLYISLGDGGGRDDEENGHVDDWYEANAGGNGQDIEENLLGSILRIDVDGQEPYGIPADNPFVGEDGLDEIYAYGFRNPYRFSFDLEGNNEMYVGDAGQELYEEVSIVESGGNYGWNVKEGSHCFSSDDPENPPDTCPQTDIYGNELTDPVIEFENSKVGGIGSVVIGGYVYRGTEVDSLNGMYIFGVWNSGEGASGKILAAATGQTGLWDFNEIEFTDDLDAYLLGFGQDDEGEVYVLSTDNTGPSGITGKVYKIVGN